MSKIKEVIVFSEQGNPRNIRTWSNVPHFLVHTLESKGLIVNTVNLEPKGLLQRSIRKAINIIFPKIFTKVFYDYLRTPMHYHVARRKIKNAVKLYKNADALIFTTFSLSAHGLTKKPSVLFCDWTVEHHIRYYMNREPYLFEEFSINRQNQTIEKADHVFVLFPTIAALMKDRYSNPNIHYIGNVVNNLIPSRSDFIDFKTKKQRLLFVGKSKYLVGATNLVAVFKSLIGQNIEIELDIIGLKESDFAEPLPENVTCHGYLDKGNPEQRERYYNLLSNASIFINTTPKWGAFSASLEAMHFYTPVIITPYIEFVNTFGESIDFGKYYKEESGNLGDIIMSILGNPSYRQLCINAHKAVEKHSWSGFVENLIQTIEHKDKAL